MSKKVCDWFDYASGESQAIKNALLPVHYFKFERLMKVSGHVHNHAREIGSAYPQGGHSPGTRSQIREGEKD